MGAVRALALAMATAFAAPQAFAQTASAWTAIPRDAVYLTGDSWAAGGTTYRLYGVQACLRGTTVTNAKGMVRDCGEISLAMLVALIRDLHPQCYPAARSEVAKTLFVFCIATPSSGAGAGSRLDLGTALISTGFAFAALGPDGQPVHAPYFVAQMVAHRAQAGLWAFADLPEPNAIILRALREKNGTSIENAQAIETK